MNPAASSLLRAFGVVVFVASIAPTVAFVGFAVAVWGSSKEPIAFPLWELPGFYAEAGPSVLAASCLLAVCLLVWSKLHHKAPERLQASGVGAFSFGVFYGYQFIESLFLRSHFSTTSLLIGTLGLMAGAIAGALIPRRLIPVWQST
jgi:hypothetical protein